MMVINKATLNSWLCEPFGSNKAGFSFHFHYGSKSHGSPWQHPIPVTALLMAALRSGKVKITAKFNESTLVGGFYFLMERTGGNIVPEDFDDLMLTRDRFDRRIEYRRTTITTTGKVRPKKRGEE